MDILERIREQYPTFNKTQCRIADYLLQHPDMGCFSSLRQLAQQVHTTEATILNFSRRIGCKSFLDLKGELQSYISQWMSPNDGIKAAIQGNSGVDFSLVDLQHLEEQALRETFSHIAAADIQKVLVFLRDARRVIVIAHDYSCTVADLFAERFIRLGVDVLNLAPMPMPDVVNHLALCAPDNVVVVFSYAPYSPQPIQLAQYMHKVGCRVVCFSDSVNCPISPSAETVLVSVTNQTFFFNSMTAPAALINALASLFVLENKERFETHKEKTDAIRRALGSSEILPPL